MAKALVSPSSFRRILFVNALMITAMSLPLVVSPALAAEPNPYAYDDGSVDSSGRVLLGQTSLPTRTAQDVSQLSPSAGDFPSGGRQINGYLPNAGTVLEEDRNVNKAPPAPASAASNASTWHLSDEVSPSPVNAPVNTAPPMLSQPAQGMTEQVIYPPEQKTAPTPMQPQQATQPVMESPVQNSYAAPAPVNTVTPRLVWVEGPKGQPMPDSGVKAKKPADILNSEKPKPKPKKAKVKALETDTSGEDQSAHANAKAKENRKSTNQKKIKEKAAEAAEKKALDDAIAAAAAAAVVESPAIDAAKPSATLETPALEAAPKVAVAPVDPSSAPAAPAAPVADTVAPTPIAPVAPTVDPDAALKAAAPPAPPSPPAPPALPPAEAAKAPSPPPAVPAPLPPAVDPDAAVKPPAAPALPVAPTPPPIAAPIAPPALPPAAPVAPALPPAAPALPAPASADPDAAAPKVEKEESAAVKATANAIAQPAKVVADGKNPPDLRIVFKTTETTIPLTVSDELNKMAKQLIQNDNQRVTLIAYASAAGDQVSTARRISLSRALSVRAFLIDAGVNNLRINVQAEGDKNPGGEADRVDLYVQNTEAAK